MDKLKIMKINIVCLKWGTKFGPEYVNNLYNGIARNTSVEFSFHCLTDDATGLTDKIITHDLPYAVLDGWWNKLYLFSNELQLTKGEKIFYVDLDTVITGNLDDIINHDCKHITVLRDFYTGLAKSVVGNDNVGSGLMSWYHGDYTFIWDSFIENPEIAIESVHPHGDQKWIQNCISDRIYWQDVVPNQVVSFKVHCKEGLPDDARIICYHGKPSIPESITNYTKDWIWNLTPAPWIGDYWK